MWIIKIECNRGEDFGVMVWKTIPCTHPQYLDETDTMLSVSRQIGNPAEFETEKQANTELNAWIRRFPAALDNFSFNVCEV